MSFCTDEGGTPHDPRQCRRALALLEACLEELKVRSDADCRRLHRHLDARIAQVLAEVKQLGALVVEGDVPDAPAQLLAAQARRAAGQG